MADPIDVARKYNDQSASDAPYGVIDLGDKIIVGAPHGEQIQLSNDIKNKIRDISQKHGAWYEGAGGDIEPNKDLVNKYKGSWDDLYASKVKGYPTEYLAPMFSNVDVNKPHEVFEAPNKTIMASLIENQDKMKYFKDRRYDEKSLREFLKQSSEGNIDFIKMSQTPATKENLSKFFKAGESLAWPENWQEYPNKLGQLVRKTERGRNKFLLDAPPGVYFAGAGHIPELKTLKRDLNVIGGERSAFRSGGAINMSSSKSPAWTRSEGKNPEGGLNEKGRASLRAAGHDIKRPQPEGGARKDSFCARMKGMKAKLTSSETANDPDSRINKSLRKWNCRADGGAVDIARQYREDGGQTQKLEIGGYQKMFPEEKAEDIFNKASGQTYDIAAEDVGSGDEMPSSKTFDKAMSRSGIEHPISVPETMAKAEKYGRANVIDPEGRVGHPLFVAGTTPSGENVPLNTAQSAVLARHLARLYNYADPADTQAAMTTTRQNNYRLPFGLSDNSIGRNLAQNSPLSYSLPHEVGHAIHNYQGMAHIPLSGATPEATQQFQNMANERWKKDYGSSVKLRQYVDDPREQFAEGVKAYLTNPAQFKRQNPDAARFLRDRINSDPRMNKLLNLSRQEDQLAPAYARHGGAIDIARNYRETGGRSSPYNVLQDLMKKKAKDRDDGEGPSSDPTRNVTPEEYRRGNLGRGYYALSNGGRSGYAIGGTPTEQIANIYQDFLGRDASPEEISNAQNILKGGADISQFEMGVANSPEAINYGNSAFVSALYNNLMGRDPDEAGLKYWVNQLGSGNLGWEDAVNALQSSEEAKQYAANNAAPYQVAGPSVASGVVYPNFTPVDPEKVQNQITGMSGYNIPNVAENVMNAPDVKYNINRIKSLPINQAAIKNTWGDPSKSSNFDWTNSVAFARALEQSGIPRQAALAIAGNAGIESAAGQYGQQLWDVKEAGGKGPGVGSLQFTYPSRKEDFLKISQQYGGSDTMAGNVAAIVNEMKNPEYAKMVKAAAKAENLQDATAIIGRYYENPNRAALYKSLPQRVAYAQQLQPQYEAYASKYPYAPPPVTIYNAPIPSSRPDQSVIDSLTASGSGGNVSGGTKLPIAPTISNPNPSFTPTYSGGWSPPGMDVAPSGYGVNNPLGLPPSTPWYDTGAGGVGGAGTFGGGGTSGGSAGVGGGSVGGGGFSVGFFKDGGAVDIARSYRKAGGPVWDKPRPKSLGKPEKLSPSEKSSAKAAAKAAGRPYPNLVDNMRAAREDGGRLSPFMEAKIEEIGDKELGKYGLGPNAPASTKDELKAGPEQSTWEKIAEKAMGDRPSPERRRFVEGAGNIADVAHLGSYATPLAPYVGAVDFARGVASGDPMEAALGATGLPGKGAKAVGVAASTMMPESAEAGPLAKALNAIRAYHGSPHKFDKFDISKIGTGEGAQAYGHGLYFAESPGVARSYRDTLSGGLVNYKGEIPKRGTLEDAIAAYTAKHGSPEHGISALRDELAKYPQFRNEVSRLDAKEFNPSDFVANPGHMYEVDIHADPSHMLDWDKPLSEHPEYVRSKMNQLGVGDVITREAPRSLFAKPGSAAPSTSFPTTGRLAYQEAGNTQPEATEVLNKLGIPGIKYLDQGSRGAGEGTSNYVVFDPNIIEILRRYKDGGYVE